MKGPAWSTHELKVRGWTPAMIRDLLGRHDRERASDLRVGSRDRLAGGTVKLYLQERVEQVETTQAFADAQELARAAQNRAQTAADSRRSKRDVLIDQAIAAYPDKLVPHPEAASMSDSELLDHHWWQPHTHKGDWYDTLGRMSRSERERLFSGVDAAHLAALSATYPDKFPALETHED